MLIFKLAKFIDLFISIVNFINYIWHILYLQSTTINIKENKNKYKGFKFNDIYFDIKWPIKVEKISKKDKSYKIFNLKDLK